MMEDARQGHFDVILAKNQSRFSRNFLHIEQYLHRELPNLNIRFIGVTDGVDTGKINNIAVRRSGKKDETDLCSCKRVVLPGDFRKCAGNLASEGA